MLDTHAFWKDPDASEQPQAIKDICRPEFYLDLVNVTSLVVTTLNKIVGRGESVLELGCGTGRNLAGLSRAGYKRLSGIEINPNAIAAGRRVFPELRDIHILCASIEEAIEDIPRVDCIFTQGVLMHLPPSAEWVFPVIADTARKVLITIENEEGESERAWPRNYGEIFGALNFRELRHFTCEKWPPLPVNTICRIFVSM